MKYLKLILKTFLVTFFFLAVNIPTNRLFTNNILLSFRLPIRFVQTCLTISYNYLPWAIFLLSCINWKIVLPFRIKFKCNIFMGFIIYTLFENNYSVHRIPSFINYFSRYKCINIQYCVTYPTKYQNITYIIWSCSHKQIKPKNCHPLWHVSRIKNCHQY